MSDTTAPFISEAPGSFEDAEKGGAEFPSTVGDTMDWFGTTRAVGRQFLRSVAEGGMQDPLTGAGQDIIPPEQTTPPDVLQKKWGIPGKLDFNAALPEDVAESMYGAKREEIARADAIARRPAGIINSATRYGAQFVADLLDPVNLAATMIPIAPEIDLGVTAASPLIERIGARAVQGGVGGAAGMAPLAGLKYGMGRQEGADYDGYNALADIATGAGIGAVLHVGGGALGDYLSARVRNSPYGAAIEQSPDVRNAMLRTGLAQMMDDRPVEVRPIFDSVRSTEPTPEPSAPAMTGEVMGAGDLWRTPPEQLEEMLGEKQTSDHAKLVRAFGSEEEASEFNRLDRKQNSSDPDRADEGAKEFNQRFGNLTSDQERLVYGIGETDAQESDIQAVLTAHTDRETEDPTEAAYEAARAMRSVSPQQILEVPTGNSSATAQAAYVRLRNAYDDMSNLGVPRDQIGNRIIGALVERGGWSAADANEIVNGFTEQLRQARQQPLALESASGGDPAGEHPQVFDQALRSASGDRPPNPNLPEAEAAVKAKPPEQLQAAQQQVDDHEAFFQQAEAAGALTEEVRAELESIHDLDTQASDYGKSALSAAGCIARGMSGEA